MKQRTDAELVAACLEGSEAAWAALIERYKHLIYSVPVKYGLPPEDAADVFQTVCVELYSHLSRLREHAALRGWLVTVATHQCFHWKRRARRFDSAPLDADQFQSEDEAVAAMMETVEREQQLRDAIAALPPRCARMIRLLFFTDPPRPYVDVARELGLATGSIGFIRGRCLEKLRQKLLELGFRE